MINGSKDRKIIRIHGIDAPQQLLMRAYLQGHVYDWCQNRPDESFYAYTMIGIKNCNWHGTPLQGLYDYYLRKGRGADYAHAQAARAAGWLLWQVIVEDERNFGTQPGYKRKYWWVR